jgi:hypothetical protein
MAQTTKRQLPRPLLVLVTTCCSLLIAGCAGPGRQHVGVDPCNPGECKATVKVENCAIADIPKIRVWSSRNIEWTIETAGYRFPEDGIVIDGTGFRKNPGVNGNGRKFTVLDEYTDVGRDIKYTVRVVRDSNGAACPPLDPMISNE